MDIAAQRAVVEQLYAALRTGDGKAVARLLHPDFAGAATPGLPLDLGGSYDSPEAMQRDFWWRIGRSWTASAEPDQMHALDDGRLLVSGTYRGASRSTGRKLDAAFLHLLTFEGERIVGLEQLTDSAAWASTLDDDVSTFTYRVDDAGVAHVTLARPDVRNAINLQLARDTLTIARRLESDDRVRAVLISGQGPHFTVGGDISTFLEPGTTLGDQLKRMVTPFHEAFRVLSQLDVPIVTATRGAVAGGGIGYVYASDISIASESSRFVTAFADLGVSGDGGWSWHLPRRVGAARAAEITLLNRPVDAAEAGSIGLVSRVVPDAELDETALATATALAAGPTRAYAQMRRLLRESWSRTLAEQLAAEVAALGATGATADSSEAVAAFVAKRPPTFEGR